MRVWDSSTFTLKFSIDEGPDTQHDMNFVSWHPKGNVFLTGGKDNLIWMLNGMNGQYINCFSGHKEEVIQATFDPKGKVVISASSDLSIKVWNPRNGECIRTIKKEHKEAQWHEEPLTCFAIHHE